jgi:UDP-3-O-[3-hydroxymyristoyl] glucosamine N-acyltransferase
MTHTIAEIASIVGGKITGDPSTIITGVSSISDSKVGDITFVAHQRYEKYISTTKASCVIVPSHFEKETIQNLILVDNPYNAIVQYIEHLLSLQSKKTASIHPTAIIGNNTIIGLNNSIGPNVVIGDNCTIGDDVSIFANTVIESNCTIGRNSIIRANVTCYERTYIGENTIINSGTVIGSDGFGFIENSDGSFRRIPHIGNVVIGNYCDIGSNTTIDRGTIGSTIIEDGVKIDNLVQIAHNVRICENTAIASQAGIAGSTTIGKGNRIGGQVGVIGHLTLVENVIIHPQTGVSKNITKPGHYFGSPAKEHLTTLKQEAALNQLPQLLKEFRELKNKFDKVQQIDE